MTNGLRAQQRASNGLARASHKGDDVDGIGAGIGTGCDASGGIPIQIFGTDRDALECNQSNPYPHASRPSTYDYQFRKGLPVLLDSRTQRRQLIIDIGIEEAEQQRGIGIDGGGDGGNGRVDAAVLDGGEEARTGECILGADEVLCGGKGLREALEGLAYAVVIEALHDLRDSRRRNGREG